MKQDVYIKNQEELSRNYLIGKRKLKVMHLIRSPQGIFGLNYIAPYRISSGLTPSFLREGIRGNTFVIGKENYLGKDNYGQPLESMYSDIVIKHSKGDFQKITKEVYLEEGEEILFPALKEQIRKYKPDLILAQNPLFSEIFALSKIKKELTNAPKIIDYCGCSPFIMELAGKKIGGLEILVENKDAFDRHVSISEYTKRILEEKGITSDVIYAGINLKDFSFQKPKNRKKIVMYSGRFHPDKGAQFIPEIVEEVMGKTKDVKFVLAGYGPMENEIRKKLKKFNGNVHISTMGKNELNNAYLAADTYFQPSVIEAFCVSAVEAMAAGNNMVYSGIESTALEEVIGDTGVPIRELNPKLYSEEIIHSLNKRETPNKEAIERVKDKFDIEKKAKEWIKYFKDLVI